MTNLTLAFMETEGGFNFRRSDGERFFLIYHDDGSADLYLGVDRNTPPQTGIVNLDRNLPDKLARAEQWILAYPNRPSS